MLSIRRVLLFCLGVLVFAWTGCSPNTAEEPAAEQMLVVYPADDLVGLIAGSPMELDPEVTSDGGGSLRVSVVEPSTFPLYEAGDLDIENARLIYRAKLCSADLEGQAYLEMLCAFGEAGEYFSRGLNSTISGTAEWRTLETLFLLESGQNPSNVRLNLVVDGTGTVWIDDIEVLKAGVR